MKRGWRSVSKGVMVAHTSGKVEKSQILQGLVDSNAMQSAGGAIGRF